MGPKGSRKRKAEEPVETPVDEQPADDSSEDEREDDNEPETDYTTFQQQIKQKERQVDKFCVMLSHIEPESEEDDEEEEEKEPTMEQLQALARIYVPKEFKAYFEEVIGQLEEIGYSEPDWDEELMGFEKVKLPEGFDKYAIRMLNTRHSPPMQAILQDRLKRVDKACRAKKWSDAFCWWLATTLAAKSEQHWYIDTESPEVAEGIYKKLRTHWIKLKEHSEEELGGLVLEGSDKSVKAELDKVLQGLADDMNGMEWYNLPTVASAPAKGRKK